MTGGYKGLQGVTKDYRNFFLTRTLPDTFSWFILHKKTKVEEEKIKVEEMTKTMGKPRWKNSNFAFFINSCFYSL